MVGWIKKVHYMPNVRGKGDLGKRDLGRKGGKTHSFFSQSRSNLQSKQTVGSKGGPMPSG